MKIHFVPVIAAREVNRVLELIQKEKAAGRVILLVSHRLNDALAVSDRIVVLKRGQIYSDVSTVRGDFGRNCSKDSLLSKFD